MIKDMKYTLMGVLLMLIFNASVPYFVETGIDKNAQYTGFIFVFSFLIVGMEIDLSRVPSTTQEN